MRALKEKGFNSFLIDDTRWGHYVRAYAIGYLQSLIDVVEQHSEQDARA